MKHTRLALLLTSSILVASPAHCAVVTMLQFGSYQTRAEAEKRLSDVSAKYKTQLNGLELAIREVKLPTVDLTVYRTQAGPVENRANAQGICAQLASAGDECYVIQSVVEGAAEKTAEANPAPAAESAPQVDQAKPDLTQHLSMMSDTPAETPKDAVAQAQEPAAAEQTSQAEAPVEPMPAPEDEAQLKRANEALDTAIVNKESTAETVANATSQQDGASRGFWYWLNPSHWGEDSAAEPTAAASSEPSSSEEAAKATVPDAPVTPVVAQPTLPTPENLGSVARQFDTHQPEETVPPPAPAPEVQTRMTSPVSPAKPSVSMNPRATDRRKSEWIEVGPFANSDAALTFWKQYQMTNPDFPVMRVRTVINYQQQLNGFARTWLRVGPVSQESLVKAVCGSISHESKLECTTVIDIGVDASRDQPAGGSRYNK